MGKTKEPEATRCDQCSLLGCPVSPRGCRDRPLVAFVGEAPGENEVKEGQAFVGEAGKLMNRTLATIGWDPSQIYFTNVLMWRPAGNRDPKPHELAACHDRLMKELAEVDPYFVVAIGGISANSLLGEKISGVGHRGIMKRRGMCREIEIGGKMVPLMPTLHPAGLLRQPDNWAWLRDDLLKVEKILDGHPYAIEPNWDKYVIVDDQSRFEALLDRLWSQTQLVAVDIETSHPSFLPNPDDDGGEILCIGFSWKPGMAAILDWQRLIKGDEDNRLALAEVMEKMPCSFQGGQYDVTWLWERGIQPNWAFDTLLGHYTISETHGGHGLKRQAVDRYWAPYYDDDLLVRMADFRKSLAPPKKRRRGDSADEIVKSNGVASHSPPADKSSRGVQPTASGGGQTRAQEDRKLGLDIPIAAWSDPEMREMVMKYCGADADYTQRLSRDLPVEMEADGVYGVMDRILMPAAWHFAWLEKEGMLVDTEYLHRVGHQWIVEQEAVTEQVFEASGDYTKYKPSGGGDLRPWFASHDRLQRYLYEDLGLRQMSSSKRDGLLSQADVRREIQAIMDIDPDVAEDDEEDPNFVGFSEDAQEYWRGASSAVFSKMKPNSVTAYMLYWLGYQHVVPRLIAPWRKLDKKINTYYLGYVKLLRTGDRIHPRYRVSGARTGRISCTDPNIHGVAKVLEIKRVFIADPGYEILYSDRSQAEIRMLAHVSGDEVLRQACEGSDMHFSIACDLFQMTPEQMRAQPSEKLEYMRRSAKTIAFGIIYGRMPNSLAPQLGCSVEEATQYRERFLGRFKKANAWMTAQRTIGRTWKEVESIYGRKRRFPYVGVVGRRVESEVERQAVNTPIQGAVSDMTLEDNIKIREALFSRGIDVLPWPHVHDGFMLQVARESMPEAIEIAKDILAHPSFETRVRFAVEIKTGPNMADLHTVYKG